MTNNKLLACLMKTRLLFLSAAMISSTLHLQASDANENGKPSHSIRFFKDISGHVTDAKNEPLSGATVQVKGTNKIVVTDANGNFRIKDIADNAVLVVSYSGFSSEEVAVTGSGSTINIVMKDQQNQLGEVVVIGYGTTKKKDLTGAVAQVKATQFENENPRSVQDMLRGNAPGLDVSFNASPKGGGDLLVRGRASLNASTAPLLVVDGVIYPGDLADINPNDISTLDILKDASSAAVFGARSANGVILITTKKGKTGKPTITLNSNYSKNFIGKYPKLLKPQEFLDWREDVLWSMRGFDSTSKPNIKYQFTNPDELPPGLSVDEWKALTGATGDPVDIWLNRLRMFPVEIANYKANRTTDWEDLLYDRNSNMHDHTVSVSGRKEEFNYYTSFGYLDNEGLSVNNRFKTFRARTNVEGTIAKWLTTGVNLQFSDRDESPVVMDLGNMIRTTPYAQLYADDGVTLRPSTNDDPGNNANPFLAQFYTDKLTKYTNIFASVYAKGKLPLGFFYQVNFTPRFEWYKNYTHLSSKHPFQGSRGGITERTEQTQFQWQLDNILGWNKQIGKNSFDVTFLVNAEKFKQYYTRVNAENYSPNDNLGYNAIQAARTITAVVNDDQYATGDALMGRINYSYDEKYYITVTGRRDGYSAFGQGNPRAFFPSAALGWVFSSEKFMRGTSRWLDFGKLRLSYGENGNREIGRYAALSGLAAGSYEYITPSGTRFSLGRVQTSNMSNPNLKWERNSAINIGVDFSFLRNRLSGSFDWYKRQTKDLLMNRTLPNVTGFTSVIANLGQVNNSGFEFSLNSLNMRRNNFVWRTGLAFWVNKNEIVKLYGPVPVKDSTGKITGYVEKDDIANNWFIGKQIGQVFDYNVTGVWQVADDVEARKYGFTPGDFRLEDLNGDGKYTVDDRKFIGSQNPKFSFNLRNEFTIYRDFEFSFALYARIGQLTQYNEAKNVDLFYDRSQFYSRPYWTPENPINDYAKMMSAAGGVVAFNVWRKSSFVRLNNISLAYNVPKDLVTRWKIQALKFYVNVQNAAVFTNWEYFDPENKGLTPVIVNFGLNLTL
jgi:TonB-linked SusC/RagA family outer membrane protein